METPTKHTQQTPVGGSVADEQCRRSVTPTEIHDDSVEPVVEGDHEEEEVPVSPAPTRPCVATPSKRARPQGNKSAKEEQRQRLAREHGVRLQQHMTGDMAAANFAKAQVLQDQTALSLFVMPDEQVLID
jgi:hypothetical protein